MACRIGLLLYVISQLLAFLCVLVGTPIDMFRVKHLGWFANTACVTLWGEKAKCFSTVYIVKSDKLWANCTHRRLQFRVAQAFAVISIFVYGLAFILGFIMLFRGFFFRWVCLTLNILGIGTLGIVWVLMVVVYYTDEGQDCPREKVFSQFGAGFTLFLVAWCLKIIGTVFLLLESQNADVSEKAVNAQDSKEQ